MNENVIQTIENKYTLFSKKKPNEETYKFDKSEIEINEYGCSISGILVNKKAESEFLKRLRVRPGFTEIASKTTSDDWGIITSNLKKELPDRPFYAKIRYNEDDTEEIYSVVDYPIYEDVELFNTDLFIETVCKQLKESKETYKMFSFQMDDRDNSLILGLINESTMFDVFDGSTDTWMSGMQFRANETKFVSRHLLERLICTNGMTTKDQCFQTHIERKNFNNDTIIKMVNDTFEDQYKRIDDQIKKQASVLRENQISINEFYKYSKPILKAAKEFDVEKEAKEIFDDSQFFGFYGDDIKRKSNKWKSTAKTGISAYDFFNAMTYTATHLLADVSPTIGANLQLNASKFFFNDNFDINEIAPDVPVNYSKHIAYN